MGELEVAVLASNLMEKHNLKGWSFKLDNARKRFGACNYTTRIISISRHLAKVNNFERVKNTILHEIAHALTPNSGHGREWQRVARSIGCDGDSCYSEENTNLVAGKYKAVCGSCGYESHKYKVLKRKYACRECCIKFNYGAYSEEYVLSYVKQY